MEDMLTKKTIPAGNVSLEAARALIDAALAATQEAGFPAAIAVTDATGSLRAFARDDAAPFLTAEVAISKAWTAASYGYPTHVWNEYVRDPAVAPLGNHPRLMAVGGGFPIMDEGRLVGGIGISGGNAVQDEHACMVALEKLGFTASS
ncbi:GlcG/HbpS family heme-binding protein [Stakelama flava]|nr:heme-binding protein [Stakelama flava]